VLALQRRPGAVDDLDQQTARRCSIHFLALASPLMPSRIVTSTYRPKRPPRKKAQAAAITGPAIVTAASKRDRDRRREMVDDGQETSPEIKAFFARMMRPHGS
jgi:hypothetical protein